MPAHGSTEKVSKTTIRVSRNLLEHEKRKFLLGAKKEGSSDQSKAGQEGASCVKHWPGLLVGRKDIYHSLVGTTVDNMWGTL